VSFSGAMLTYQDVLQNLNLLDYEYYFKATDFIIKQDIPSLLVLFNDILTNGFDGHNFIEGLGEHYRNLLVCKDKNTLPLLQGSDNVKVRYENQSNDLSFSLLLSGLAIINQADVQYKTTKNQRLLVELTLMKLCGIPNVIKQYDLIEEKKK